MLTSLQIDSMLPCVCSVIDHRLGQNVVRKNKVAHETIGECVTDVTAQLMADKAQSQNLPNQNM